METYNWLKDSHILVTGANGLIGTTIINKLFGLDKKYLLGIKVTALVRNYERAKQRFYEYIGTDSFEIVVSDVCDERVYEAAEYDYIICAASNSHPKAFAEQPVETMKANLKGVMNILDYACNHDLRKVIYLSSGEVYGEAVIDGKHGWKENVSGVIDSMQLRSCYPEAKRASETLCVSYFSEYKVPVVVARLAYIYGENIAQDNTRADVQFFLKAKNREDILLKSDGKQLRSYCYADDAADAILLLLEKGEDGEVYNIANMNSVVSIREFAETMAKIFGVNIVYDTASDNEKKGYSKMKIEVLNSEKLYALGWKPRYSLCEGLNKMLQFVRS